MPLTIKIKKNHPDAIIPSYQSINAAALDLYSLDNITLIPKQKHIFNTKIKMEIPEGYFGSIRDRSGLAANHGIHVLGGVVDSDYRGEVGVILINLGDKEYNISKGERIAQMVIHEIPLVQIQEVDSLSETKRDSGGFGSTGK